MNSKKIQIALGMFDACSVIGGHLGSTYAAATWEK